MPSHPIKSLSRRETDRRRGAVVAQLALYEGQGSAMKLANADYLLQALKNYNRYFNDIFSGIGEARTHDDYEENQLAPYFGPATVPYAFEAMARLEKEPELSPAQKDLLVNIRSELQKKLLNMFEEDGLFKPQDGEIYPSAKIFDNALTGLALASACNATARKADPPPIPAPRRSAPPVSPTHAKEKP
jgi:hypothetical protein